MPIVNPPHPFLYTPQGRYTLDSQTYTRVFFSQEQERLLHDTGNPSSLLLLLPEEWFSYHTITLQRQQHTPLTITQLKNTLQEHIYILKQEHHTQAKRYTYKRHTHTVNGLQAPHLLGSQGCIATQLSLVILKPTSYIHLSGRPQHLTFSCIPRSQYLLQQDRFPSGSILLIEKQETKILHSKNDTIVSVHLLNTGYDELLDLLAQQSITPSYISGAYMPFQQEILTKTFQDFWNPLQERLKDCVDTPNITIISDILRYPDLTALRTSHIYTHQYCMIYRLAHGYHASCLFSTLHTPDAYSHTRSKRN